ncbi:MAG: YbaN family protein [Fibrobacterota bacterium]
MNTRKKVKPMVRKVYMLLGLLAAGLGSIGIVLPLLPTTPFFILSSWFFVKSSPRLYRWLAGTEAYQRTAGAFLTAGGLTITAKLSILIPVLSMLGLMFFSVENIVLKGLALVLAMAKTLVFIRIPTLQRNALKGTLNSEKEEVV